MRFSVGTCAEFDEWQEAADRCAYATFFHTPVWTEAFARTFPGMKTATLRFQFEDGAVAFFPLVAQARAWGALRSYLSSCAGCYGGWVSVPFRG